MRRATQREERRLHALGYARVAGVDEAGRGPLAGPLVAAAVVLPDLRHRSFPHRAIVRDSKTLSSAQRCVAAAAVRGIAEQFGIGEASAHEIDSLGLASATRLAMRRALDQLHAPPDHILIDGNARVTWRNRPCSPVVSGDSLCTAVAAASILAKVRRDTLMEELDLCYPAYGFARHKGYAVREHLVALARLGPCPIHRRSFAPLRLRLALETDVDQPTGDRGATLGGLPQVPRPKNGPTD